MPIPSPRLPAERTFLLPSLMLLAALASPAAQGRAATTDCAQPLPDPITRVSTSGSANPVLSRDGCWLFVMAGPQAEGGAGVVVLRRERGTFTKVQTIPAPVSIPASGMVLTNDQKLLIASAANSLTFIDVEKATSGASGAVVGQTKIGGAFRLAVSPDDATLFVAQFAAGRVAVFDLDRARRSGFSAESLTPATVPTGQNPITVIAAPDGRHVYATNLVAPDVLAGPLTCIDGKQREGGVQVIDVQKARTDAATATLGWAFPAGCGPNAMALSPDGSRLSNTAANNIFDPGATGNVLVVFDTRPLRDGTVPTRVASVPLPKGPIAIVDTGSRIIVGFQPENGKQADLLVVDTAKLSAGAGAVAGTIPFPAGNLALAADGRTLIASASVEGGVALIDLERVALQQVGR